MVVVEFTENFEKVFKKIKNVELNQQLKKHIKKIVENPEIGKPMMFKRKGTREVYLSSFRISNGYYEEQEKIIFLDFYHKDQQ